jgi:hypothetical protein
MGDVRFRRTVTTTTRTVIGYTQEEVEAIVLAHAVREHPAFMCGGRHDACRPITAYWLSGN